MLYIYIYFLLICNQIVIQIWNGKVYVIMNIPIFVCCTMISQEPLNIKLQQIDIRIVIAYNFTRIKSIKDNICQGLETDGYAIWFLTTIMCAGNKILDFSALNINIFERV